MIEAADSVVSLPTVIWSGIIAALISLAGVVLSNWSSGRRLQTQLAHDASEKQKDRLGNLRREVYLQLYADINALQGHFGGLAAKDPTSSDFATPIQVVSAQLAKVQLVGGDEVAKHAGELTAAYTECLFELMIAAKPLHQAKVDINLAEKYYKQFSEEVQRVNNEMTSLNESGKADASRMKALQRSYEGFNQLSRSYSEELNGAWARFSALQPDFLNAVKEQMLRVAPVQAQLMAALKNEIGVKTDVAELLLKIEESQQRMEQAIRKLMAGLAEDSASAPEKSH